MNRLEIFAITGIGEIGPGVDLADLLLQAATGAGTPVLPGDIVVVSSKVLSKAENRTAPAAERERLIEAATVRPVAARRTPRGLARIVRAAAGPVMAAAGVDASNVAVNTVLLLPVDPDASARTLHRRLRELTGHALGVIVSDTAGRPWRDGQIDFALGAAGIAVVDDLRGTLDANGQPLEVTVRALADEIAAAADLVKGKADGLPVAVVRGLGDLLTDTPDGPGAAALLRSWDADWFRYGHVEAVTAGLGLDPATIESPTIPTGQLPDRLGRVIPLAIRAPNPAELAGDPADQVRFLGTQRGAVGTVTLVDDAGEPRPAQGVRDWAALGALAQRISAAAWAEDLRVEIELVEGPPPRLRIIADERSAPTQPRPLSGEP